MSKIKVKTISYPQYASVYVCTAFIQGKHVGVAMFPTNDTYTYDVAACVSTSKRQVNAFLLGRSERKIAKVENQSTGGGFIYMKWIQSAMEALEHHIQMKANLTGEQHVILIEGSDERRFRAYRRYARTHGYKTSDSPIAQFHIKSIWPQVTPA